MTPRVVAGFYLHKIKTAIKECMERGKKSKKEALDYAEKNHQICLEMSYEKKKVLLYLFIDIDASQKTIDDVEGAAPVAFAFHEVGRNTGKMKKLKASVFTKEELTSKFVVTHRADSEGMRFMQSVDTRHVSMASSSEFVVDMFRSNAGVDQHFRLTFKKSSKKGSVKLQSAMLEHTVAASV